MFFGGQTVAVPNLAGAEAEHPRPEGGEGSSRCQRAVIIVYIDILKQNPSLFSLCTANSLFARMSPRERGQWWPWAPVSGRWSNMGTPMDGLGGRRLRALDAEQICATLKWERY